jgi:hypothetical protein
MNVAGSSLDSAAPGVRLGPHHVSRSLVPSRATHPPNHHRAFLSLRYDQDISYDGIRREGIQDPSHALISRKMTIVLDAVPRPGF